MSQQKESRALVFVLALGGYIGYRLYKKYAGRGRGLPPVGTTLGNTLDIVSTLLGNKDPKLVLQYPLENTVGQNIQFRILFEQKRRNRLFNGGARPETTTIVPVNVPQGFEEISSSNPISDMLNEKTEIEITKIVGFSSENISIIREFTIDPERQDDVLVVTFTVRESGLYEVRIKYNGRNLHGSPFVVSFLPTTLDCDKTGLVRQSPTLLVTIGSPHSMLIEPKDKFGNLCRPEDIHLEKFSFEVTHVEDFRKSESVGAYTYNFIACDMDDWGHIKTVIRFESEIFEAGTFKGIIRYENKQIGSGLFDIITLSSEEQLIFKEMLEKAMVGNIYHMAQLQSNGLEIYKKPKVVYLYTTPKLITVKEFFLRIIPSRIATFRIHPALRIQLMVNNQGRSIFKIFDRVQSNLSLEMDTTSFRLVLALFAHFLQQRLGGSESFENKQKFFYEELRNAREEQSRLFVEIRIDRNHLIDSSLGATKSFGVKDWCKKFKIHFIGEEGTDDGGLRREWLNLLCSKLFENNPQGLFCTMGNSRLVHPNPNRVAKWSNLCYYELAGKIVAKCLFETAIGGFYKQMVNGRFSRSFLAQIIGFPPSTKYFEQDDPEYFLGKVKYLQDNDVDESMDLTFTEEIYLKGVLVQNAEIIPGGSNIKVTNENKADYLNALAQFRLGKRVQKEVEAFCKGLNEIIPDGLLMNFEENELEILMCGKSTFQVQDLKFNHIVTIADESLRSQVDKLLPWFWTTIENMTDEERGRLLQFTTGSSLLPHGGFKELQPTFRITVLQSYCKLPIAHTCFNEICLSIHKTYEEFQKSFRTAINEGSEGFGFM